MTVFGRRDLVVGRPQTRASPWKPRSASVLRISVAASKGLRLSERDVTKALATIRRVIDDLERDLDER